MGQVTQEAVEEMDLDKLFNHFFFNAKNVVTFKKEWSNGTGYYNGLTSQEFPEIAFEDLFRTVDPYTNRRIIGMKLTEGNAVVFERYSQSIGDRLVIVSNLPFGLKIEGFGSNISTPNLRDFFLKKFLFRG